MFAVSTAHHVTVCSTVLTHKKKKKNMAERCGVESPSGHSMSSSSFACNVSQPK